MRRDRYVFTALHLTTLIMAGTSATICQMMWEFVN
jgi:hypothetical protein